MRMKTLTDKNPEMDPLILAIETATRAGSVAVNRGESLLSAVTGDAAVSHSANLIQMIEQALAQAGQRLSDVDLFAAASGPGSFTGLRIGLATVKALAVCAGREVQGVNTLAAVAHAAAASGNIVALLPAGRGEVFAQLFSMTKETISARDEAAHLTPQALLARYGELDQLHWTGDGAAQQIELLRTWAGEKGFRFNQGADGNSGWSVTPAANILSCSIAILALRDYREGKSTKADELHAVYVRPSDAEINEQWQRQKAQR